MVENVLLITIDSLRMDHLTVLTLSDSKHSRLAVLRDEHYSFNRAFATGPGTTPSFPAMLTGTMPLSYGGLGPMTEDRPRIGEFFQASGLATAGFQCNPFLSKHFNYDRGFDKFEDYQNPLMGIATRIFPRGIELNNPLLATVDDTLHITDAIKKTYQLVKGKPRPYVGADIITNDTIKWLNATDEPFFCWTHYMDVHHPCFPPEEYRHQFKLTNVTQSEVGEWYSHLLQSPQSLDKARIRKLRRLYRAAIVYVGDKINHLLTELLEMGKFDDTLIIITSDHGELFGEHNQYGKPERMYDELLHVPLIIANGPGHIQNSTDDLVSLLDIPPLINDALGLDVPDAYEGRILGVDEPRDLVMAEHEVAGDVIVGARSQDWLYEGDEIRGEHRLFDMRDGKFDKVEIKGNREESAKIRYAVIDRLETLNVESRRLKEVVEDDVQSRLEDLGYL